MSKNHSMYEAGCCPHCEAQLIVDDALVDTRRAWEALERLRECLDEMSAAKDKADGGASKKGTPRQH
jgi:hypothetical protein